MIRDRRKRHYKEFDSVADHLIDFLNDYQKSAPLQQYAKKQLRSFVYANLVIIFFRNLTSENVRGLQLPFGQIRRLKKVYASGIRSARASISMSGELYEEGDYRNFREKLRICDPDFVKLLNVVEQEFDMENVETYLSRKDVKIEAAGRETSGMDDLFIVSVLEALVQKVERFPHAHEIESLVRKTLTPELINDLAQPVLQALEQDTDQMLADEKAIRTTIETNLFDTWKESLELLECLIKIAAESGEQKANLLGKSPDYSGSFKRSALVQIHARTVHISNEILTLLKAGYADGANSRWRSLYELTVVSLFLYAQSEEISERFLAHDIMKAYKEAKEYRAAYRKLGYPPFGRKESARLKRNHDKLVKRYGREFRYQSGYEWIPASIIHGPSASAKTRVTFRQIEKHVKLHMWRPFYSLSSNAVHPGARGLFRLGLIRQDELLLVGPSNYGLADPLQNTAISLAQVTTSLLTIEPGIDDLLTGEIVRDYSERIGESAVRIQNEIEKRDSESLR